MNPHIPDFRLRACIVAASLIALLSMNASPLVAQTAPCSAPSTAAVNICSPLNGSVWLPQRVSYATYFTISAAGMNTNGTAGMDVWLDGIKLGYFANTSNVNIDKVSASQGFHQLDVYAEGVDGELKAETSFFYVGKCTSPSHCPGDGYSVALPFPILFGTGGDVWLDGIKLGYFENGVDLNATAADGPHQLDVFYSSSGTVYHQTARFTVLAADCTTPTYPDVNICSPANGFTKSSPFDIVAIGRNTGPTAGMDVWLDGVKQGFVEGNTVAMKNVKASVGPHQLDIYAVGTDGETKPQSSSFEIVPCAFPASGVHTCSPANPAFTRLVDLGGRSFFLNNTVASPFSISAAGRNINGTAGMDVWLDGVKLDFFSSTETVNLENVKASVGNHQLDIYAVGVDGEKALQSTVFNVSCTIPDSPGVNICSPQSGSTPENHLTITATGRNSGPTAGMDIWLDGTKIGFLPGNFVDIQYSGTSPPQGVPAQLDVYAVGVDGELQKSSVSFTF